MNPSTASALQPDKQIDRGKEVRSPHIYHKNVASMEAEAGESRTELDSYVNKPVVRREALVVIQSEKTVEVSPFTPDYKKYKSGSCECCDTI